jgi:hypothetical protein
MNKNKFDLIFEDIMQDLSGTMIEYELFENIVNRNIATALNISLE